MSLGLFETSDWSHIILLPFPTLLLPFFKSLEKCVTTYYLSNINFFFLFKNFFGIITIDLSGLIFFKELTLKNDGYEPSTHAIPLILIFSLMQTNISELNTILY